MSVEVLVSCMNQKNHSLLKKMKINSNAIFVNQCDKNCIEEFKYNDKNIKFMSLSERGVGLSRNTALMRAQSDIVIFADEDEIFTENYKKIILKAFADNRRADIILFNILSSNDDRKQFQIKKVKRIHKYNFAKFGAVRIAVKLNVLREKNIFFSLLFGGGAKYSNGEDSLFIMDCLKAHMKIYTCPEVIGTVEQNASTWFNGYTKKYFNDRGILYKKLYGFNYVMRSIVFLIKIHHHYKKEISFFKAFKYMINSK